MTNDTPLWYMDGTYLKHRNRPSNPTCAPYILDTDVFGSPECEGATTVRRVLQIQPMVGYEQLRLLYNEDVSSSDCAAILRTILIEQSQAAEANTASLGAQLAQARDDYAALETTLANVDAARVRDVEDYEKKLLQAKLDWSVARDDLRDAHKWYSDLKDSYFKLMLQHKDQTIEYEAKIAELHDEHGLLKVQFDAANWLNTRLTESLNEKTLALNNMRQFYRNTDAELDRMREYVRQVTQERTAIKDDYKRLDDAFVKLHQQYTQLATTVQHAERMRVSALELSTYTLDNSEQK